MDRRWNYVLAKCEQCQNEKQIRIDQFNRNNKKWICRTCSRKGKTLKIKNPSPAHDLSKLGTWKSYWRAKRRCKINHKGVYENVEFRFNSFDEWFTELGPRPEGMSVDRINPHGHYEPGNIRWATAQEQSFNKRNNHVVSYNGEMLPLGLAAKAAGLHRSTLERRIKAGCPDHLLFTKKRWRYKGGRLADEK